MNFRELSPKKTFEMSEKLIFNIWALLRDAHIKKKKTKFDYLSINKARYRYV